MSLHCHGWIHFVFIVPFVVVSFRVQSQTMALPRVGLAGQEPLSEP
jgi:hypothetical protein